MEEKRSAAPKDHFLIYGRGGKSTGFPQLLLYERQRTKRDLDIKHAKTNIWKREIRPDHNVKSYFNEKQRKDQ